MRLTERDIAIMAAMSGRRPNMGGEDRPGCGGCGCPFWLLILGLPLDVFFLGKLLGWW